MAVITEARFVDRIRDHRPSGCSCRFEPGCWGADGWHWYALPVAARAVTRVRGGGKEEQVELDAYEVTVAYARCEPYWVARNQARAAAKAKREPGE